jgi:hypothetical protein
MRSNFFEFTWSEYNHFHFYVTLPTENSEDKNLRMYVGFWKLYFFIGFWPVKPRKIEWELGQISNQYGFSYFDRNLIIYRGEKRTLFFQMPWSWQIVRHDLLMPDGKVYHSNRWDNAELGKKAGSWKGGLMGWSCEWDPYENMESAFRRWYDKWDGN